MIVFIGFLLHTKTKSNKILGSKKKQKQEQKLNGNKQAKKKNLMILTLEKFFVIVRVQCTIGLGAQSILVFGEVTN